eukprot:jgi/Galph1/4991/GphlegSOOS_G3679.1
MTEASGPSSQLSIRLIFQTTDYLWNSANNLELFVPDTFGRKSLRKTIGQLVDSDRAASLDFAIDGTLLRSSLGKFCETYNKSKENVLEITCFEPDPEPEHKNVKQTNRWLSSISCFTFEDYTNVASGDADGGVSGWKVDQDRNWESWELFSYHEPQFSTVVGLEWYCKKHMLFVCLQMGSLACCSFERDRISCGYYELDLQNNKSVETSFLYQGSENSNDIMFLGTYEGPIFGLPLEQHNLCQPMDENVCMPIQLEAKDALQGHSQRISSVMSTDSSSLVSTSWDGALKVWDLNAYHVVSSTKIGRPIHAADCSLEKDYIITGNIDGSFTVLDQREGKAALRKKLAHQFSITGLCSSPVKNYLFATTGRDNKVKVWDMRALSAAFYEVGKTKKSQVQYMTCICWDSENDMIISGSSSGEISSMIFGGTKKMLIE